MKSEKGQALPLAMMALAFGTLVIAPFLGHASTGISSSRVYGDIIMHQGACDAGIEHAIWSLTWGDLAAAIPEIGDEIAYPLPEPVNNLTTMVTVITDVSSGEGVPGVIEDKVLDTLVFDTAYGQAPAIIHISGNTYAIAYRGNDNDGLLKTVEIDPKGAIANNILDSLEYDFSNSNFPDIVHVSGDIFAIAYQGSGNDGFLKTIRIAADGDIDNTVIDTLEFDTGNGREPVIVPVSENIYAIAYRGNNNDGFLITVQIDSGGDIGKKIIDSLEYDKSDGYYPSIINISGEVYAIAYRGTGGDGFLKTLEITEKGKINNEVVDSLEFDTSNCNYPDIVHVSGNVFAIAYQGSGNDGFLKTIRIAADGAIDKTAIDTLEFDTGNGREPVIVPVSENIYTIAYRGNGNYGSVVTAEITSDGSITQELVDSLEFDTSNGYFPDITRISGGILAIAYCGPGNNGFIKTVEINTDAAAAAYRIVATTGLRTIEAGVNITGLAASVTSWRVE